MTDSRPVDSLSQRETQIAKRLLWAFLGIISLPYLIAAFLTPPGQVWGGLLFSADDQNVHLMWARQAQDGAFFVRDLFTTEGLTSGERPLFWNALTWLMGIFARVSGLEVVVWYHVFRVALAGIAIWQLHELSIVVTRGEARFGSARLWILALAIFTTGGGFLATFIPSLLNQFIFVDRPDNPNFPMMPEAFLGLSAFAYPLNIAGFALLAFVFCRLISGTKPVAAFIAALLLANIHTYDALPLLFALVAALFWHGAARALKEHDKSPFASSTSWRVAFAVALGVLIPIAYQIIVFRGSEEFRVKALTSTLPPAIWHMAISFAPLLILSFFGLRNLPASRAKGWLVLWIASTFLLVYTPFGLLSFARKMIEGVHLPLLVLAGIGEASLLARVTIRRRIVAVALLGILALSPLQFLGWTGNNFIENNSSRAQFFMPPLYLSDSQHAALQTLNAQTETGAVLCLPFLGSYVPRATGKFTFLGHWAETLNFKPKLGEVARIYQNRMTRAERDEWLKRNQIRWIVSSIYERAAFGESAAAFDGLRLSSTHGEGEDVTRVYEIGEPSGD